MTVRKVVECKFPAFLEAVPFDVAPKYGQIQRAHPRTFGNLLKSLIALRCIQSKSVQIQVYMFLPTDLFITDCIPRFCSFRG